MKYFSGSLFSPCKIGDNACIEKSTNDILPQLLSGIPELGVESSDPLFIEKIDGNLSILKYKFFNSTLIGYKTCNVKNVKWVYMFILKINYFVYNVYIKKYSTWFRYALNIFQYKKPIYHSLHALVQWNILGIYYRRLLIPFG